MKSKLVKSSLILMITILGIIGIYLTAEHKMSSTTILSSNYSAENSSASTGSLASGETDPNGYSYNIHTGEWDAKTLRHPYEIPVYGNYQIYCVQPGNPVVIPDNALTYEQAKALEGKKYYRSCGQCASKPENGRQTYPHYVEKGGGTLSPAAAYIVSIPPKEWTIEKQKALWNLRHTGSDGGILNTSGTSSFDGATSYDAEAQNYATHDSNVRGIGLQPEDTTNTEEVTTKVNQSAGEYVVGPFSMTYTEGIYDGIAFSGITEMKVIGDNGQEIEIDRIILDSGEEGKIEYFEPSDDEKIDRTAPVLYPKSGQKFHIVFKNPNDATANNVKSIKIKVKFQYMLANGQYTNLEGTIYTVKYNCNHGYNYHTHTVGSYPNTYTYPHYGCETTCWLDETPQQDLIAADAIRSLYEQELELAPAYVNITMGLGGLVFEDEKGGKETLADGFFGEGDKGLPNIKVTLYDQYNKVIKVTSTNKNGYYLFDELDAMKKYYVSFEYNGMVYMPTTYGGSDYEDENWNKNSNATERTAERDSFDKKFEVVGNNGYKQIETLQTIIDNIETNPPYVGENGQNEVYKMTAYTKEQNATNTYDLYPKYDQFVINYSGKSLGGAEVAQKRSYNKAPVTVGGITYKPIYEYQLYINLGLWGRQQPNVALTKDLLYAATKINGKTETYKYNKRTEVGEYWTIEARANDSDYYGTYSREIYPADYYFRGAKTNGGSDLELYVTYKITAINYSQTITAMIKEVTDYYDKEYDYVESLSWVQFSTGNVKQDQYHDMIHNLNLNAITTKEGAAQGNTEITNQNGQNVRTVRVKGLDNKKLLTGEKAYIFLTFKVKEDGDNPITLDNGTDLKQNYAEITTYATYYGNNTVLPNYGNKGPKDVAGIFDINSIANNLIPGTRITEDDSDRAKNLDVKLYTDDLGIRSINGIAWEDKRDYTVSGSVIGDGIRNENIGVKGVTVELVEKLANGNEYVWYTTTTDENGKYEFKYDEINQFQFKDNNKLYIVPGNYIIRFKYGHNNETVLTTSNGGANIVSYNGQDFKTTVYQKGMSNKAEIATDYNDTMYNIQKADDLNAQGIMLSDAKDLWTTKTVNVDRTPDSNANFASETYQGRDSVINYSNSKVTSHIAEVLASPYRSSKADSLINELIAKTNMTAETGIIVLEGEYNRQGTDGIVITNNGDNYYDNKQNGKYSLNNVDLGLTERPKAQLELNKKVTNIKVTLANGNTLFDAIKGTNDLAWTNGSAYDLNTYMIDDSTNSNEKNKYKDFYGTNHRYAFSSNVLEIVQNKFKSGSNSNGLITVTMDEELMHGASIKISYELTVKNSGETDYTGQDFYYKAVGASEASKVKTTSNVVLDYVANNLQYRESDNSGWKLANNPVGSGIVNAVLTDEVAKFNIKITTEELSKALKPGETTDAKSLVLTQLITPENTSDDMTYENIAEIVSISNDVGRRMAYSIQGNQNPSENPTEVDSAKAEKVLILPPFGSENAVIYITIGVAVLAIITAGVIIIKKKVIKK